VGTIPLGERELMKNILREYGLAWTFIDEDDKIFFINMFLVIGLILTFTITYGILLDFARFGTW